MRALVFGAGRSGSAAAELCRRLGGEAAVLEGDAAIPGGSFDVAIVSPGVPSTHPWLAEARRRGIPLQSELQFGCEELRRRGWKLLAVTGSKGKSSVVKLVAEALSLAGRRAVACGNYGVPVCAVACSDGGAAGSDGRSAASWAVVEVSSFMLETTALPADAFEAAAILNLQEDHLDRHGTVAAYHALKRRLLAMTPVPLDCPEASADGGEIALLAGSYFDNDILRANGVAAARLLAAAGVDADVVRRAFAAFEPLPHRMNVVAEIGGVRYVDDSKATSIAALVAGVTMASNLATLGGSRTAPVGETPTVRGTPSDIATLGDSRMAPVGETPTVRGTPSPPPVRLIAGGLPKGDDPKIARSILTARVKKVYLIGHCAEKFLEAWKSAVDCEVCGTMEAAVGAAKREAGRGDIVLLSPGTASFDQFKSFEERGEVFARLVQKKETQR